MPKKQKSPPLIDNPIVTEQFGDHYAGCVIHDDNAYLTFAVHRATHEEPPKMIQSVSIRAVITMTAMIEMYNGLTGILDQLEQQGIIKRPTKGPATMQ